ncbi:precorrin-6y C5,15-methyltransferase (decarboxylating) subunit CbiE [Catenulispora sp. NL8]|uniref:Precorrin-6y C5,15-methyltransferase (Decarboxylating) subunit CbiE n=1 Tax=Catenulispora pinistramenti TaxID=2705254 RepID=A0ABS5L7T8_9ACTN|nr:precorrin-6y C5,15-methyltransferase (decarboxylating) subunit CbiE [Catenulispora pinistramenti]MBS2554290.1 precorrin-6y C5,15-methyltransferase (decarboxylating) subunit CbiE [Catenulispora pinistramenti]
MITVTVIGFDGGPLSDPARAALAEATLVVGGRRHLDAVGADIPPAATRLVLGALDGMFEEIARHEHVCVIASGDPGFFGIVRQLREYGLEISVLPAPSSVATAFAAIGLSWDDAIVVSAHGRELRPVANVCRAFPKVAVLTGPGTGAKELGAVLPDRTFVVAQRLGHPDQRIDTLSSHAAAHAEFADPHVLLCLDESRLTSERGWIAGFAGVPGRWALAESEFTHRASMITKSEIRALALAKLGPRPGRLVWDIGSGSGSVGVECARFGAAVLAVERDAESCDRIRANAATHDVTVEVVTADALSVLARLPQPDAVFVGGGGTDVIAACAETPATTVVVALAAIERVPETISILTKTGRTADGALLQSSRLSALPGDAHRFAATNPVFLLWGERR